MISNPSSTIPKWVLDAERSVDLHAVLHVFREEGRAAGLNGVCDHQGVEKGESVAFGEAKRVFVDSDVHRKDGGTEHAKIREGAADFRPGHADFSPGHVGKLVQPLHAHRTTPKGQIA